MAHVHPDRHRPYETGKVTRLRIPEYSERTSVMITRVSNGISVARSHFHEAVDQVSTIIHKPQTLVIVFGLSGRLSFSLNDGLEIIEICEGQEWIFDATGQKIERIIHANTPASCFVVTLETLKLTSPLRELVDDIVRSNDGTLNLLLKTTGVGYIDWLFKPNMKPTDIIKAQSKCLRVIGDTLEVLDDKIREGTSDIETKLKLYLSDRIGDKLSLNEVAHHFGVSHVSLNQMFKRQTGQTVFECLRDLRLNAARKRLKVTNDTLTQIAFDCGFSSASHLSRAFRERFGTTARSYRM